MRIKNWERFQHYKKRRPLWIKLYRELLDDPQYFGLPDKSAKYLPLIWLIASEANGYLPDSKVLSFRLRMTEDEVNGLLSSLSHWIEEGASKALANCYQVAMPEKERERETEKETEKEKKKIVRFEKPTADQITEYAKTIDFQLDGQKFWNFYESKGWLVGRSPMKNWKAAVMTWKKNGYEKGGNNGHKGIDGKIHAEIGGVERPDSKYAGIVKTIRTGR